MPYGTLAELGRSTKIALGFAVLCLPFVDLHAFPRSPNQNVYLGNHFFSRNRQNSLGFAVLKLPPRASELSTRFSQQNLGAQHIAASALEPYLALVCRGWASQSAGFPLQIEYWVLGRGSQASRKQRYLRKRRVAAGDQAPRKARYLRGLVWASRFPNWASRCPRWAPRFPNWAPRLRCWALRSRGEKLFFASLPKVI